MKADAKLSCLEVLLHGGNKDVVYGDESRNRHWRHPYVLNVGLATQREKGYNKPGTLALNRYKATVPHGGPRNKGPWRERHNYSCRRL